jgi:methionyl-tRNA formyltransferase
MTKPLRLIFMGTPIFAVKALDALIQSCHEVVAVYTQPPKPSGRGYTVTKTPVHTFAEAHSLPVLTPRSLKVAPAQEELSQFKVDIAVVAAYGLLLPLPILQAPRLGCINIHASLLPRWRGAAPIHRALLAGDAETGITFMQMDEGLDTGKMLKKVAVKVTPEMTTQVLHDQLAEIGARHIVSVLEEYAAGRLQGSPQDHALATYAQKLAKSESELDWGKSALELERQVRAFHPWPGSYFQVGDKSVKVLQARVAPQDTALRLGEVFVAKDQLMIGCRQGALEVLQVQPAGKKPMTVKEYLNGANLTAMTVRVS